MFEYARHEGNYGLMNILAGSREAERSAGRYSATPPFLTILAFA